MITTKTLRLDVTKRYTEPINLVQYEVDARVLDIRLSAGGLPVNVSGGSVVFYAQKPDGTILYNACVIVDAATGHVTYTVTEQTCAAAGELRCWVLVIKDESELRSLEFTVTVQASEDDTEAVESTSEFTALEAALALTGGFDGRITQNENDIDALETSMATAEGDIDDLETAVTTAESDIVNLKTGWIPASGWSFVSVDDPVGVITVPSGHGITVGMRIMMTNGGNIIYGIVVVSAATTLTFLHEIDPTDSLALYLMADSAITNAHYSPMKTPAGFPTDPDKWTIKMTNTSSLSQLNPTANVWYNLGTLTLIAPIGAWFPVFKILSAVTTASGQAASVYATLSTANNSETISEYTLKHLGYCANEIDIPFSLFGSRLLVASKTTLYLNSKTDISSGIVRIYFLNSHSAMVVKLICAYL